VRNDAIAVIKAARMEDIFGMTKTP